MTNDPDFQVIDRILAGDSTAYAALVDRHKSFAYTIAWRILGDRNDAEEAAQDGFVKAFRNLSDFGRQSKFSTWLYRIIFNTAISYKRRRRRTFTSLESASGVQAHASPGMEHRDRRHFLELAMSKLNEADQAALTLFYLKDFSLEEIGEITGQVTNTVKVRVHRARQRLAEELKGILKEEALTL